MLEEGQSRENAENYELVVLGGEREKCVSAGRTVCNVPLAMNWRFIAVLVQRPGRGEDNPDQPSAMRRALTCEMSGHFQEMKDVATGGEKLRVASASFWKPLFCRSAFLGAIR